MPHVLDTLITNIFLFITTLTVLGFLVGSFLNVVIYRLPKMMERTWRSEIKDTIENDSYFAPLKASVSSLKNDSNETYNLAVPASSCPQCGHKISALENIPVLSYLYLKGQCRGCSTKISPRYPVVELITGILSGAIAYYYFSSPTSALFALLLTWSLIALTGIDYDTYLLPDSITLPLLWLGLVVNYHGLFTDFQSAFLGAAFGYLSLWSVFWLFKLLTGKEGMGYGDFKLLAALGAWMGWQMLPLIVIVSSFVGAVIGVLMIVFADHEKSKPIPFGPYLAIAGWIALVWGNNLNDFYLQFSGIK